MELKLHPAFVHFPIALFFLELALLVLWRAKKDGAYRRFAGLSFRTGYAFMAATMAAGLADAGGLRGVAGGDARRHFVASLVLLGVCTLRAVALGAASFAEERPSAALQIAGALAANAAVVWTAYYGGRLVYA